MFDRSPFPSGFYADLCLRNLSTVEREHEIYAARSISLPALPERDTITLSPDQYEVRQ